MRALHAALEELSFATGFDAITVSDITKSADVHRSTFYRHYRDKFHMIETLYEDGTRKSVDSLLVTAGRPAETYRSVAALAEILDHFAAHRDLYHALLTHRRSVWFEQWLGARWTELIHQIYARLPSADPPKVNDAIVDLRARIIVDTSFTMLKWWIQSKYRLTSGQMACWYVRHIMDGFSRTVTPCPSAAH
ncbi:TetR/AcrR family transcriptional regulator [Streptosporangium sp. KLBMP 9127]|nr:TetR/AcrR family transcriptional regulator [Streptosporangium sp. KLBMP 9127]